MIQNILITGGQGFIGRNLKEHLDKSYRIYNPGPLELDICDFYALDSFVKKNYIDVIIHAAHYNQRRRSLNPDKEVEVNMRMFFNIEKLSHGLKKVLYFGSGAEFDKQRALIKVAENDFGDKIPDTPYAFSKYIETSVAQKSENIYNLRCFGLFGKYEDWQVYFISNLCCKAMYGLPLTIRQDCKFDYLYIDDFCNVVKWFLENNPRYHDYNICSGQAIMLSEIAEIVRKVAERPNLDIIKLKDGLNLEYTGNNERILTEMGDMHFMPMKTAVLDLYRWYESNIHIIDLEILKKTK